MRTLIGLPLLYLFVLGSSQPALALEAQPDFHDARVLMDMEVWLVPPEANGYCVKLPAGTLNVTLQAIGQGADTRGLPWPVEFSLYGYRGFDDPATINVSISSLDATTASSRLQGGDLYCFYMRNTAKVPDDAPNAVRTQYWQGLNVRMTLTP